MADALRPLKDPWGSGDEIAADDMQAITDRLKSGPVTVTGRNVREFRSPNGGSAFHVDLLEEPKSVLCWVYKHITATPPSPYSTPPAGKGGMYWGQILRDVGVDSTASYVGDWYASFGVAHGTSSPLQGLGGRVWPANNTSYPDAIIINLAEFGVTESDCLLLPSGNAHLQPTAGAIWQGMLIGMTRHDDTPASTPVIYIKGVASFPCQVNLTSSLFDATYNQPGIYKGKLLRGAHIAEQIAAGLITDKWTTYPSHYENTVVINLPERHFGTGGTPWLDVSANPTYLGQRVSNVNINAAVVDRFHVVWISEILRKRGDAVADVPTPDSGAYTADGTYGTTEQDLMNALKGDVGTLQTAVNALLASLRASGAIKT